MGVRTSLGTGGSGDIVDGFQLSADRSLQTNLLLSTRAPPKRPSRPACGQGSPSGSLRVVPGPPGPAQRVLGGGLAGILTSTSG